MLGVYFSGTGNSKHCVETFVMRYDKTGESVSIENKDALKYILKHDFIVLGYPVYFSNAPKIVQDFINENGKVFKNKKIFIIATMATFSGDGTGCTARILKKYEADIVGGLHLKMPDSIGDEKVFKRDRNLNLKIINKSDLKIINSVQKLKSGNPTQDGLGIFAHVAGLLGQRLWFYNKTTSYKNMPKVDIQKCIGCNCCVKICSMKNLKLENGKAISGNKCTLCYRCVNNCPTKALTILGKKVHKQYMIKDIFNEERN